MITKQLAACLVATTMLAAPALAQNNAPSTPAPATTAGANSGAAVTGPNGVQFYTQTGAEANWRASKFSGVNIYGSNNEKIGDVKDIILDHDGVVQAVVIGVGGFLGIGEKDVAVPFKSVEWQTQPMRATTAANGTANTNGTANNTAANTTAANNATMNNSSDVTGTTANSRSNMAYPDHGVLRLTKDQLKAAPSYRYPDDTKNSTAQ